MIEKIEPWIKGKKVLILGFGREGKSTFRLLKKLGTCEKIDIADIASPKELTDEDVLWISGPDYQKCLDNYDVVFKSPGIVLERPIEEYKCRILSQTQVFVECFREQIIGITGTKGKSTVTTLVYHLLKESGMDALLVGNIGIPAFDHIEEITPNTKIVFELSCHQLEYMSVSPHIGVLLNLHEEHLDHYGTMEKYVAAKYQIFSNQKPDDIFICSTQCLPPRGICPSHIMEASFREESEEDFDSGMRKGQGIQVICGEDRAAVNFGGNSFVIPRSEIRLMGSHNYFDIGIAYGICRLLGMTDTDFEKGLKTYIPLPHRLQYLGEKDGIKYYDDSISTICDTTIQALHTVKDVDTVLIGGMDRGIDYRDLIEYLSGCPVPHIILMEATGKRIYQEIHRYYPEFSGRARLVLAEHLEDAVRRAKQLTRPGRSCLLSPAAASYGIFKNFEERGEVFARLVLESGEK